MPALDVFWAHWKMRFPAVPAVKNHRVYLLRGDEFVVPGPRIVIAANSFAHVIHPEIAGRLPAPLACASDRGRAA